LRKQKSGAELLSRFISTIIRRESHWQNHVLRNDRP
jgi:hypothetical protein